VFMRPVIIDEKVFLPLKGQIKKRGEIYVLPIPKVLIDSEYFVPDCDYRVYFERVERKEGIISREYGV
jgi:hypothetical protein